MGFSEKDDFEDAAAGCDGSLPAGDGDAAVGSDRWALIGALGVVLLTLVYGLAFFPLRFETNDDVAMLGIARGFFGNEIGEPRLINMSAFIGALVGSAFKLAPGFDAYSAFHWLAGYGSVFTIAFVWLKRSRHPLACLGLAYLATAFFTPVLFELQFTKTSLLCVSAAVVLLLDHGLRAGSPARLGGVVFFALLGTLIRSVNQMAGGALLLAAAACAAAIALARGDARTKVMRRLAVQGGLVAVILVLAGGLEWAEEQVFYGSPDWQQFWQHRTDRAYVIDNWPREIGRERIGAELEHELGITPQQYGAVLRWLPVDSETYSSASFASMAKVVRALETKVESGAKEVGGGARLRTEAARYAGWLSERLEILHAAGAMLVFAACFALLAPRRGERWRAGAIGLFWSAALLGLLFGVHALFRTPPHRVWMPLMMTIFAANAFSLLMSSHAENRLLAIRSNPKRSALVGVLLLGSLVLFPLHRDFLERSRHAQEKRVYQCGLTDLHIRALASLPETGRIFLAPQVVSSECLIAPMRMNFPAFLEGRLVSFGWRNLTPWARSALFSEHENLIDLMCNEPGNVFVLNPYDFQMWRAYLDRHRTDAKFARYSESLPPAILKCEIEPPLQSAGLGRDPNADPSAELISGLNSDRNADRD